MEKNEELIKICDFDESKDSGNPHKLGVLKQDYFEIFEPDKLYTSVYTREKISRDASIQLFDQEKILKSVPRRTLQSAKTKNIAKAL